MNVKIKMPEQRTPKSRICKSTLSWKSVLSVSIKMKTIYESKKPKIGSYADAPTEAKIPTTASQVGE